MRAHALSHNDFNSNPDNMFSQYLFLTAYLVKRDLQLKINEIKLIVYSTHDAINKETNQLKVDLRYRYTPFFDCFRS